MTFQCRTEVLVGKLICEWTIDNFSFCNEEPGEFLSSPVFSSMVNDKHKWSLNLYPRGISKGGKDYVSLFLVMSSFATEVRAKFKLVILNANGDRTNERNLSYMFTKAEIHWGYSHFIERDILFDEKQLLLPDDKLTVLCEVADIAGSINTPGDCIPVQVPECSLLKDFDRLFQDQQLSDVILSTPSKEYKVHKAILAARSPVFAALFQHEMEENRRININMDGEVLEEVLRYMYTGKAPNLDKMADKLLIAADKYDMKGLKTLCEKSLCDNLAVGNAADALIIADIHGAEVLKKRAIAFIYRNLAEITETAGWEKLQFSFHLVTEVCRASIKQVIVDGEEKEGTVDNPS